MPLSLVFPESFVTPYFHRDIVIYLYEEDIFDDDFIGKTDTFRFSDAIEEIIASYKNGGIQDKEECYNLNWMQKHRLGVT